MFVTGTQEAFVERFSDEFWEGGEINTLTKMEHGELFFASMNIVNEGNWGVGNSHNANSQMRHFINLDLASLQLKTTLKCSYPKCWTAKKIWHTYTMQFTH